MQSTINMPTLFLKCYAERLMGLETNAHVPRRHSTVLIVDRNQNCERVKGRRISTDFYSNKNCFESS